MSTSSGEDVNLEAVFVAMNEGKTIRQHLDDTGCTIPLPIVRRSMMEKYGRETLAKVFREKIRPNMPGRGFRPLAPRDQQRERMQECKACEKFQGNVECGACGCPVANLVAYSNGKCPHPEGPRWY
jgi:hypothetical protein